MKAVVYEKYGPPEVLQIREIPKPTPKDNEVLIKIHATNAAASEVLGRRGETIIGRLIIGIRGPRKRYQIPGMELAGEVEAVGKNYTRFKPGDQVYGFTGVWMGCYAQYKCMTEKASLVLKPANLSYEEAAAAVDGATTALTFLRTHGKIQPGQKVLIIGASGCIGAYAVQLAKYFGADVTGVCSGTNADLVKSLGADHVIDYTKQDFTQNGETYDIIFDTVGKSSFSHCKGSLTPCGRYLITTGNMLKNYALTAWTAVFSRQKVIMTASIEKTEKLNFIKELIEAGTIKPVIDRCYPLEAIVEAHRLVDSGHKKGSVIIQVSHS